MDAIPFDLEYSTLETVRRSTAEEMTYISTFVSPLGLPQDNNDRCTSQTKSIPAGHLEKGYPDQCEAFLLPMPAFTQPQMVHTVLSIGAMTGHRGHDAS